MITVDTNKIGCCDHWGQHYECVTCGVDLEEECYCVFNPDLYDELTVYCHGCGTISQVVTADIVTHYDDPEDEADLPYTEPVDDNATLWDYWYDNKDNDTLWVSKCRHYNKPVEFPDGTTVHASSMHDRDASDEVPDLGLYLDTGWKPMGMAYTIHWPDFNIPPALAAAGYTIVDTYNKAKAGCWVEVGCIGGHGRTGTVLACMAVLAGVPSKKAVSWVRNNYCKEAVESKEQEWMVEWFDAFVNGGVSPAEPLYDYSTKKYENGPSYSFEEPLVWGEFDLCDYPSGGPSEVDVDDWDTVQRYKREKKKGNS